MSAPTQEVLERFSTIAVVGLSREPSKAAHGIPRVLQASGFRVIPVNPFADELLGERAYATLADVPEPVEVVLVFRPAAEGPGIAREAAAIGAHALWLQLGLRSDQARRVAEAAGMLYVEDRCMGVERAKYGVMKQAA